MIIFTKLLLAALLPLISAKPIPNNSIDTDPRDRYIAVLKPSIDVTAHLELVHDLHRQTKRATSGTIYGGVTHTYNISSFQAYAGHFPQNVAEQLRHHEDILSFEPDAIWEPKFLVTQTMARPGLSMISHRSATPKDMYWYDHTGGMGTHAYIVDSGINIGHVDFQRRAIDGHNELPMVPNIDVTGHGTHVAGIVGSNVWGVAKQCRMISVKVFHDKGAHLSTILAGYQWAVADIKEQKRQARAGILLATNGPPSKAFDAAVKAATKDKVLTVLAAGNEWRDAGKDTPGATAGALVVGAVENDLEAADFSNFGPAVNVWAPGVEVMSAWIGSPRATKAVSGTSQAAAYALGVALYLKGLGKADAKSEILKLASKGMVKDTQGAANLFLYNGSGK